MERGDGHLAGAALLALRRGDESEEAEAGAEFLGRVLIRINAFLKG